MTSKTNKDPVIAAVLLMIHTLIVFQGVLHHDFITTDDRTVLCRKYGYQPDPGFMQALR